MQLGQSSLSSHLLHHAPCPTLVIPFKGMSSEGSMPEGGLPPFSPDGAIEMSPRESMDTSAPAASAPSGAPAARRISVGGRTCCFLLSLIALNRVAAWSPFRPKNVSGG